MFRLICITLVAVTLATPTALSQKEVDSTVIRPLVINQLLGQSEAIPEGYSLRMTGAVPPGHPDHSVAAISLGMGG